MSPVLAANSPAAGTALITCIAVRVTGLVLLSPMSGPLVPQLLATPLTTFHGAFQRLVSLKPSKRPRGLRIPSGCLERLVFGGLLY